MAIVAIEVNIFYTISFGLRHSSFIQAFGLFAVGTVSLFPRVYLQYCIDDKTLQRGPAAVRTYAYLSIVATLAIAAIYIIQTFIHYHFKVCN